MGWGRIVPAAHAGAGVVTGVGAGVGRHEDSPFRSWGTSVSACVPLAVRPARTAVTHVSSKVTSTSWSREESDLRTWLPTGLTSDRTRWVSAGRAARAEGRRGSCASNG